MKRYEIIRSYYEANLGKDLPEYSILGWESEEAQKLRFDILSTEVSLEDKKLLDVGCGTGSLLSYLTGRDIRCDYTGVDILQRMVDYARGKHPEGKFFCVDIFKHSPFDAESFDVIYASGIFNLNLENNMEFLHRALDAFSDLSREAVVFNLLHFESPNKEDLYYYYHPDEVNQLAEQIAHRFSRIHIVEHYLQNDFTVICRK